ncbi:DUF4190 domain-containing protein [Pendulispora brunnea]|uniref:DUF4190 domain-containing protein n=1 Tax=Pendulispora brunnea TaxID=2905690 RepID=A0ABZ2KI61_9BACT
MQSPPEAPIPPPPGAPAGGDGNGPPPYTGAAQYGPYPSFPQQQQASYPSYPAHGQPVAPYPYYGAPIPNESKAVTSLVFGVLSISCMGILAGIPAVVLGLLARRDIARSGGALGGKGMANAGIVLGAFTSVLTVGTILFMVVVPLVMGGMSVYSSPSISSATPPPAYSAPPYGSPAPSAGSENESSTTVTRGALRVIEPHRGSGSLERQLMDAFSQAKEKGRVVLVETAARASSASHEFDSSLSDRRMQRALSTVDIVRVDVDEFESELSSMRMYTEAVPYFYKIDAAARPTDAISADEWDANIPQNMAPVLESFVAGTLRKRRSPSPLGTTL